MQIKKFILSAGDDGVQEQELNKFMRGHRVLKVENAFVPNGEYWAILVTFMEGQAGVNETIPPAKRTNTVKEDPTIGLTPEQKQKYEQLAAIRLDISKREGVKAFFIFTNAELVALSKIETLTIPAIAAVNGIGEKRAAQYGPEFLNKLNETGGQPNVADCPF